MRYVMATAILAVFAAVSAAQSRAQKPGPSPEASPPPPPPIVTVRVPAPPAPPAPPRVPISPPAPPALRPSLPPSLQGATLYVYNFLDFRAQMFGPRMLDQISRQLNARLTENGVRSAAIMFKDSPVALGYSQTTTYGRSFDRIPIPETIAANRQRETEIGAQYRLIIIPANFSQEGAWQTYDIRWLLMDVSSDSLVWSFLTHNRRMTLWRSDENSERRGRALIDEVMADLRAQAILPAGAATSNAGVRN